MNHECRVAAQYIVKMMLGVDGTGTTSSVHDRAIRAVEKALLTFYDGRFDFDAPNKFANVRKLTLGGTYKCDPCVAEALAPFSKIKPKHGLPLVELNVDPGLVTAVVVGETSHRVLYSAEREALQLDSAPRASKDKVKQPQQQQPQQQSNAPRQYSIVKVKGRADLIVPHDAHVGNNAALESRVDSRKTKKPQNARKPVAQATSAVDSYATDTAHGVVDDGFDVNLHDSSSLTDSQDCHWVSTVGEDVEFDFVPSTVSPFDLYFPPTSQYQLKTF
jgi:hypothetical protein